MEEESEDELEVKELHTGEVPLASDDTTTTTTTTEVIEGPREHYLFLGHELADSYERQAIGSNNCFCVTAAAMINNHMRRKKITDIPYLDQYEVRAFVPEFVTRKEFDAHQESINEHMKKYDESFSYVNDSADDFYRSAVKATLDYAGLEKYGDEEIDEIVKKGEDKAKEEDIPPISEKSEQKKPKEGNKEIGNILGIGDMFLQIDSNSCLNHMRFTVDRGTDREQLKKVQDVFLDTVNEALLNGEVLGVYKSRHYRTIVGISGTKLLLLDSSKYDGKQILSEDVCEIINGGTNKNSFCVVELTWISDKSSPEETTERFGGLKHEDGKYERQIVEDTGQEYSLETEPFAPLKEGVLVTNSEKEKLKAGIDPSITKKIERFLYIPKTDETTEFDFDKVRSAAIDSPQVKKQQKEARKNAAEFMAADQDELLRDIGKADQALLAITRAKNKDSSPEEKGPEEKKSEDSEDIEDIESVETGPVEKKSEKKEVEPIPDPEEVSFTVSANFLNIWDSIAQTDRKGRSKEFCELQDAINDADSLLRSLQLGRFVFNEDNYRQYLMLYQAVSSYTASHVSSWSSASKKRYQEAFELRAVLDKVSEAAVFGNQQYVQEQVQHSSKEADYAATNVGRLLKYYRKYCGRVDEDLIASDEEKIRRKWDALKSCERDILIYLEEKESVAAAKNKPLSEEDAFLKQEYNSLKMQMMLRDRAKRQNLSGAFANDEAIRLRTHSQRESAVEVKPPEDKDYSLNKDEGLSAKQISAISKIDTWVIRNFRNGGYMAFAGMVSDRTDIVTKLMAMSRRKRLYIYHLIESRERLNPTADGFIRSQTLYEPNLKEFKNKMICNKLKFYNRFSGGYIYWNKLTEAMGIADRAQSMLDNTQELLIRQEEPDSDEEQREATTPEEKQRAALKSLLSNSLEVMGLITENQDKNTDSAKRKSNERRIAALRTAAYSTIKEIAAVTALLQEKKAESVSLKEDAKSYTERLASDTFGITSVATGTAFDPVVDNILKIDPTTVDSIKGYFDGGTASISALGALAGSIFSFLALKNDHKSMTWFDFISSGSSLLSGIAKTGKAITGACVGFGVNSAEALAITSSTASIVMAGVDSGIAVVKTASYFRNGYYRCKAAKLAAKQTDQDKFRDGMLELNERLALRQRSGAAVAVTNAALTTTAAVLIAAFVATLGISAIAGAFTLGISMGLKTVDAGMRRDMKMALFDNFFKTDEQVSLAKANWESKHPGKAMNAEQEKMLIEQVRRRISADLGFYSPNQAANAVAESYAEYLLDNAHSGNQKADMCVAMIKGLGLHYSYDPLHPMDAVPQKSDIVKKLTT